MKGYAKVHRQDLFSAIIGYEVRYDLAQNIFDKAIAIYYEKYFIKGSRWNRFFGRNKSPKEFARSHLGAFGYWDAILYKVLDQQEIEELSWWCWASDTKTKPLKALYKASGEEYILVDQDMAEFINKYKSWLENCK